MGDKHGGKGGKRNNREKEGLGKTKKKGGGKGRERKKNMRDWGKKRDGARGKR